MMEMKQRSIISSIRCIMYSKLQYREIFVSTYHEGKNLNAYCAVDDKKKVRNWFMPNLKDCGNEAKVG